VTEVAEGVHRLGDRYVNWYVIEDGGRLTVLDAGFPAHWPQLPALLGTIGKTLADIDALLLTHTHADHLGSAERVRREAGARVLVHEAEAADARGHGRSPSPIGVVAALVRPFFFRYIIHIVRAGGLKIETIAEVAAFRDGERLDVPGAPRVIHAPGHTPGTCALHVEARDVLFSGDALVTLDTATGYVGPSLLTPPFVEKLDGALDALARVEATGAGTVLPGHGEPWRDGVAAAVAHARRRAVKER
jgi:glyoxylase-like metal-dependent hydrolase (beta-lactamase superfamily II)